MAVLFCLLLTTIGYSVILEANVKIDSIPTQTVISDQEIALEIKASFVGSAPNFRILNAPFGATLVDHLDGKATFSWKPTSQTPNETVVIFQALDAKLLEPVSIKRVLFQRENPVAQPVNNSTDRVDTSVATVVKSSPTASSVESGEKLTTEENVPLKTVQQVSTEAAAPIKMVQQAQTDAPSSIDSASSTPTIAANAPTIGSKIKTLFKSKELIMLLGASYLVFVFLGNNLNPIKFRGRTILQYKWRFGRKIGFIILLSGLFCLTLRNLLSLESSSTIVIFMIVMGIFALPLAYRYLKG